MMAEGGFRHVPVVDDKRPALGMVSARDVLTRTCWNWNGRSSARKNWETSHRLLSVFPAQTAPVWRRNRRTLAFLLSTSRLSTGAARPAR